MAITILLRVFIAISFILLFIYTMRETQFLICGVAFMVVDTPPVVIRHGDNVL